MMILEPEVWEVRSPETQGEVEQEGGGQGDDEEMVW